MSNEDLLRAALARDQQKREEENRLLQQAAEEVKRQKERQADAKSKFNQLKALARGAVERLRPLLEGQGLSITSPAYVSKMRGLDRLSYHVGRDERRIVAVLSVVLRKDCMIEIENEPAAYEFNDPILTEDFFYDRFAGSIAGALDAQNSPDE